MMEPADVVLRFLESVGSRRESDFYLALFRAGEPERFAAISVDANVARHAAEAVTLDLRFLAALGLYPVVLLGLFESTEALEQATRLARRLEKAGVRAVLLGSDEPDMQARAAEAARAQTIPIVAFPVAASARFETLAALVASLRTRKLIFLHRPGGLRQGGELVQLVNLTLDAAALAQSKELSRKERVVVDESRKLVERTPHRLSVAVTSPLNLFRELFTIKGAGTLLRRGALIERRRFADLDRERLRALLTRSFGRPPADEFFGRDIAWGYVEEGYRGAALVHETPLGAYLSKFAVDAEAQGEGIGRDLWQALSADYARIFWRARASNPIDAWYSKLCDGLMRFPEWHVYWKGLPPSDVAPAVGWALQQPVDLP
ncbi:MAG: acetylglutamate kinase [bacterium]|nr:acetylglutamate kinase [bacterium]